MDFKVNHHNAYTSLVISEGNTTLDTGLLADGEREELASKLMSAYLSLTKNELTEKIVDLQVNMGVEMIDPIGYEYVQEKLSDILDIIWR